MRIEFGCVEIGMWINIDLYGLELEKRWTKGIGE
jgi:hypothetical protein